MFRRGERRVPPETPASAPAAVAAAPIGRVTSVLGPEIQWQGRLTGRGGVRIEGAFEGTIALDGLLVIAESGRVTCEHVRAKSVVVAGVLKGNITAARVEIRKTGRVWGDVVTTSFATEEGAFLRGQIRMEERLPEIASLEQPPAEGETAPQPAEEGADEAVAKASEEVPAPVTSEGEGSPESLASASAPQEATPATPSEEAEAPQEAPEEG